ncbi:hypothetical protein M0805_008434 [Coniferiporia weirii]|nr:hypothetical protein M0805_008434 [Coniferiporia weirii]
MLSFGRPTGSISSSSSGSNSSDPGNDSSSDVDSMDFVEESSSRSSTPVNYRPKPTRPATIIPEINDGVGLSDEASSRKRRELLEVVDRLHSIGVQSDVHLPSIVLLGPQSAGKSTLIEGISGVKLPRASGTCTRCPTELRLKRSDQPWRCDVTLHFIYDENGNQLGQTKPITFGPTMNTPNEVEDRLKKAQLAILNPSRPPTDFLYNLLPTSSGLRFSKNYISVQVQGPNVTDISFYDLPGWIASAKYGKASDVSLIEDLLISYIEKPSCLILLVVSCEADFEVQGAHQLVKKYDPEGQRTIGVLTKPDRIAVGDEEQWLRFVKNEDEQLNLGWYSVKQPDSIQLKRGMTWTQARDDEKEWFRTTWPWNSLPMKHKQNLGTKNLVERLSSTLSDVIIARLPELREELDDLLQSTEDEIKELPVPLSSDALAEMMQIINTFCNEVARHTEGIPSSEGLMQSLNARQTEFKRIIISNSPKFIPFKQSDTRARSTAPPIIDFLDGEEGQEEERGSTITSSFTMYIDEVMLLLEQFRTRELPDYHSFDVPKQIIEKTKRKWEAVVFEYFDHVQVIVYEHYKNLIDEYFQQFKSGGLLNAVQMEVQSRIKKLREETKEHLKWILQLESRPFTLNTRYLAKYKSNYLSYYKTYRHNALRDCETSSSLSVYGADPDEKSNNTLKFSKSIMSQMNALNITNFRPSDLAKLLPEDSCEPALTVMATVSAYFQVSCKRFIDLVPIAIDFDFVQGFSRTIRGALYAAIIKGDANARCKSFLQESPSLAARRMKLQRKYERLEAARNELGEIGWK